LSAETIDAEERRRMCCWVAGILHCVCHGGRSRSRHHDKYDNR
jgi:hypothetical protein